MLDDVRPGLLTCRTTDGRRGTQPHSWRQAPPAPLPNHVTLQSDGPERAQTFAQGGGGLAQGLGIRLFAFDGAYWPLATAHSDPLWAPERVLVVSTEPPDDLSCLTTPVVGRLLKRGGGGSRGSSSVIGPNVLPGLRLIKNCLWRLRRKSVWAKNFFGDFGASHNLRPPEGGGGVRGGGGVSPPPPTPPHRRRC